ncbi:MAG: amidohydrolase, partial [Planctomycetota bacterium]
MRRLGFAAALCFALLASGASAQDLAVRAGELHTMAGPTVRNAVVVVRGGKIAAVGPASEVPIPVGVQVLEAPVVTPGLVDAHSVVGLAGWLNHAHDQEQLERSEPVQPELRAIDGYNPREPLIAYLRGFGVTTVHTGHAPGAVVSGQTLIAKTRGDTVEEAVIRPFAMVACTLGEAAQREDGSPGTRAKAVALLRAELLRAKGYLARLQQAEEDEPVARDLRLEALAQVLRREVPLLVTAHRAHDLLTAIRVAQEFDIELILDGAAEAYLVLDQIMAAGVP